MIVTELETLHWKDWIGLLLNIWDEIKKFKEVSEPESISLSNEEKTLLLYIYDLAEMITQFQIHCGDEEQVNQRQFCCLVGVAALFIMFLSNRCTAEEDEMFKKSFDICLETLAKFLADY